MSSVEMVNVKTATVETLVELTNEGKRIVCIDADLGAATGLMQYKKVFPERYIEVGIAEQNLIGVAAGVAASGEIPFAGSFACFLTQRGGDQMVNGVGYNHYNVKLLGAYCGLTAEKNGGTHIGLEDIAIARGIPGYVVLAPGDGIELKQAIRAAAEHEGPVYIRIPRGPMPTYNDENYQFSIGKANKICDGTDIAIITTGMSAWDAIEATKLLAEEGISVCHIQMPSVKPIDREAIVEAAEKCGKLITVEDHSVYGGLGSAVSEVLTDCMPARLSRMGIKDKFGVTAKIDWLKHEYEIDAEAIVKEAKKMLG